MRNPARIPEICQLLADKWAQRPDMRLGQFLLNFIFHVPSKADLAMWNQQDKNTKLRLEKWELIVKKMAKDQSRITDSFGTSGE